MKHLLKMKEIFSQYFNWHYQRVEFLGNFISSIIRSRSVNMPVLALSVRKGCRKHRNKSQGRIKL